MNASVILTSGGAGGWRITVDAVTGGGATVTVKSGDPGERVGFSLDRGGIEALISALKLAGPS